MKDKYLTTPHKQFKALLPVCGRCTVFYLFRNIQNIRDLNANLLCVMVINWTNEIDNLKLSQYQ